jgi:phosphoribosylglycinamide formyltransferase 1
LETFVSIDLFFTRLPKNWIGRPARAGGNLSVIGVLASGRGSNCEALLSASEEGRLKGRIAVVLSDRAEAPVLEIARRFNVPARYLDPGRKGARLTPEAEAQYVGALREAGVEWIALAGFMRIVGPQLLGAYPGRIVNIHPSLLPAFPGLDAQRQALEYGVRVAGCTVHLVNEGVDTGPIVVQQPVPVLPTDSVESLSARILEEEHGLYVRGLNLLLTRKYRLEGRRLLFPE